MVLIVEQFLVLKLYALKTKIISFVEIFKNYYDLAYIKKNR